MKNFVVLLFLSSYLLSTTQLSELLKINLLVDHYFEHADKDKNITLLGFLFMHYANGNIKDADYTKDMKLPFKTLNNCNYSSINFCTPIVEIQFQRNIPLELYKKPIYIYNFSFSTSFHYNIWQPPKFC